MRSIVVVGASLAGSTRPAPCGASGFDGTLTLVGAEPHRPTTGRRCRSRSSPATGSPSAPRSHPQRGRRLDLDWRLGVAASGLDVAGRRLDLGRRRRAGLGRPRHRHRASPRTLPGAEGLAGVHVLRTLDDCHGPARRPRRRPRTGRRRGRRVHRRRGRGDLPRARPRRHARRAAAGAAGPGARRRHRRDGRRRPPRRRGSTSASAWGSRASRAATGSRACASPTARPSRPTSWSSASASARTPAGSRARASTLATASLADATCSWSPGIVAAGDVARWRHDGYGEVLRVEHWDHAIAQGGHAADEPARRRRGRARSRRSRGSGATSTTARSCWPGGTAGADEVRVVDGSLDERRFVALYRRGDRSVAALGMNRPAPLARWRARLADGVRVGRRRAPSVAAG